MSPSVAEREALFKVFGRAWFKRDVELLYEAVTPGFVWLATDAGGARRITGREAVGAALAATNAGGRLERRFEDVAYHHAPDASFMTFRLVETDTATGAVRRSAGVERYTFESGRIAVKDVYLKPAD